MKRMADDIPEGSAKTKKARNLSLLADFLKANTVRHLKDGKPLLIALVEEDFKEGVELLCQEKDSIDTQDAQGMTALMVAAQLGKQELVTYLLHMGANSNKLDNQERTPLLHAAQAGHRDLVQLFITKGAKVHVDFTWAIMHDERAAELIFDLESRMAKAKSNAGETFLLCAAKKERLCIIKKLIEAGVSVNGRIQNKGQTALMIAASNGNVEIVDYLLSQGADCNMQDEAGATALMWAIHKGKQEVVERLLTAGAEVSIRSRNGSTALLFAVERGHRKIVETLLKNKCDVNTRNRRGENALVKALYLHNQELAELLIENGADIHASLPLAVSNGYLEVVSKLVELGAKLSTRDFPRSSTVLSIAQEKQDTDVSSFLELCMQPGATRYRKNPIEYVDYHIQECISKKKYPRTCVVNMSECYFEQKGPDHADCFHQTVLMWTALFGHTEQVRQLLKYELPPDYINAQDKFGRTALMYAIIFNHPIIGCMIIEYCKRFQDKQAINVVDKQGNSALTHAIKKYAFDEKNKHVVDCLIGFGARVGVKHLKLAADLGYSEIATKLLFLLALSPEGNKYPHIL